jgi:P4 family phage/plasmid primase-like protien
MSIFKDNAPLYWAAGLPVIPLKRWDSPAKGAGKAPLLLEWTNYGTHMPQEGIRTGWLNQYPDSNIGLPFGEASGLCAIDIDTEDPVLEKAILDALPPSPWKRVGKKGMGLIYRWQGQPNFKLRDGNNVSIVEFLGKGNQMVMPPSIHPDTGRPYTSNTNLWEILESIPPLDHDIEGMLRRALGAVPGLSIAQTGRSSPLRVVPQGERDIQLVRHAGYLARVVLGIDKNEKFTLAQSMDHMRHWVENFTAGATGDDMDPEKGVSKLLEFLLKDIGTGRTMPDGWDTGLTPEQRAHPPIAEMIEKNQVARWTMSKAKAWLNEALSVNLHDEDYVMSKILELIELLSKDDNFREFEFKQLAVWMKESLKKTITLSKPDLINQFKEARRGDTENAADQEAIARQVFEEINRGGQLAFDKSSFWQWDGACFKQMETDEITSIIARDIKGNILARRHGDYVAVTKTLALIARGKVGAELEDGVNFANGFLDVNLELHPHSPKYGKTFTMPCDYIPERAGEAHKWLEYLEGCWGDDEDYFEKVNALQEAFAATMFGVAWKYQRAILLYGQAQTGKTQALNVLRSMMPSNSQSSVPPTLWAERFQQAPMVNKALNICGELPEEAVIDGRAFKEIIEGTEQNTEFKGTAIFQYKPTAAQWFASNFLPRTRDTSKGFVRRWQIFEFNRVVPQAERIVNFHEMLVAEEREAIAAWAVMGLRRLQQQNDYTQPKSHLEALEQISRSNNSVVAFLMTSDKVRPTEGATADSRAVFDCYCDHMKTVSRGYGVTFERFKQMLRELGYKLKPYVDGVGVHREEIEGLSLKQVLLTGLKH